MNETEASGQLPEFEKWVESLFTESGEELSDEDEDWRLSSQDLAEYYARLFEYPEFLAMKFTREQLAAGIWNICGPHGSWHDAMNPSVPDSIRRRCVRAIGTFYTNLLDPICISVSDDAQETDPLCRAVYMMWDMDGISLLQTYPEFQDDCVSVLWAAINCKALLALPADCTGLVIGFQSVKGSTTQSWWIGYKPASMLSRFAIARMSMPILHSSNTLSTLEVGR